MAAVTIALLLIIISFGIIIPKRLAAKEPESGDTICCRLSCLLPVCSCP